MTRVLVRRAIGMAALLRFQLQVSIGRAGYRLAARYGATGLGGAFAQADREFAIREKYGLPFAPKRGTISGATFGEEPTT